MKKADKGREEITDTERKELELLTEDKEFNQRLSKLEKEYQEIKIPDELKGRVIQAMQEARNDAKAGCLRQKDGGGSENESNKKKSKG